MKRHLSRRSLMPSMQRFWRVFLSCPKTGNVRTVKARLHDGQVSTLEYLYACNAQEYIEVLEYTSQRSVRSTTLDTWLPEQVVFMQMMGNVKSNNYWEEELPPNFERAPIENFIHAKYVEKKWASRTAIPPAEIVSNEQSCDRSVGASGKGIPKRARKYSLGEEAFTEQISQVVPTTRTRGASLDLMTDIISVPPTGITAEHNTASKSAEATTDLFSLLYVSESTQDRTIVPPSRWATFE